MYDWLSNNFAFRFFFTLYRSFTCIVKMTAKTRSTSSTQRHFSTDLTDFEWECLLSSASFAFPGHIASSSSLRQSYRAQRTEETISEQISLNHDLAAILRPQRAQTISSNSRALLVGVKVRLFRAQDNRFWSFDIQDGGRHASESGTTFERNRQVRKSGTVSINL